MKLLLIVLVGACLTSFAGPVAVAVGLTSLATPVVATILNPCTPTTSNPGGGVDPDGGADTTREGAVFVLPPPGTPVKASRTNPPTEIPANIAALYQAAALEYELPWTLLAGIGMAETNHGRLKATSSAGARGLMQFMPATFRAYGVDGDGDGRADILNDADSIFSAANYLTASGVHNGDQGVREALFAYNRAWWYVNDVLTYAHAYGGGNLVTDPEGCVPSTLPPIDGEIPQSERNVGSEARLTPATVIVKRAVAALFPTITTIGGWRAGSKIPTSDHPHGRGLDVMISNYRDPAQIALGDAICDFLIANHEVLHIKYLIWRQQSWSPQRPYWRPMANRGSDTDNHFDHVHISVID